MALFTFFGGLGLALAAIGIFGVLSYSVARRTREIGVRMASGADRSHILGLMMAMGGRLVLTGLALGLAGSLLLGRYLQTQVFSVPVTDPVAIAGAVTLLAATAFVACLAPAAGRHGWSRSQRSGRTERSHRAYGCRRQRTPQRGNESYRHQSFQNAGIFR